MNRKILLLVGTALFILAATSSAAPAPTSRFSKMFCPECWTYLSGPGSLDLKGNCSACGKYPVELQVTLKTWVWCSGHETWRTTPCEDAVRERCCRKEESFAVLTPIGKGMIDSWYCPRDGQFAAFPL